MTANGLLRIAEAAEILGVSGRTVWRMIADGELKPVKIRGCTRLAKADVLKRFDSGGGTI